VVWAADDEIWPGKALAMSLVDTNAAIIGREVLRKIRDQFGIQDQLAWPGPGAQLLSGSRDRRSRGVRGEAPRGFGARQKTSACLGRQPFWPGGPAILDVTGLPCDQGCSPLPFRPGRLPHDCPLVRFPKP